MSSRPFFESSSRALAAWVVLTLAAWPLFAHEAGGEAAGLLSGLRHPVSGLDHVVAMLAVGLWGAQLGSPALWLLPVAKGVLLNLQLHHKAEEASFEKPVSPPIQALGRMRLGDGFFYK